MTTTRGTRARLDRPVAEGRTYGQWPLVIRPKMRAVRRGVGIAIARGFREGA